MAKAKTAYVCNDCGADYFKWQGRCDSCGAWNTLSEVRLGATPSRGGDARSKGYAGVTSEVKVLADIDLAAVPRFTTGVVEFDRVLGGGLVPGSAILIGGHPGAGKSTLLLQTLCKLAQQMKALYVTGEESKREKVGTIFC